MTLAGSLQRLLKVASPALGRPGLLVPNVGGDALALDPALLALLHQRNGFYAFESALHVYAISDRDAKPELIAWNAKSGWRGAFRELAAGYLFFGQDLVGAQFGLKDDRVWRFDPETAEAAELAGSLEEWAALVMAEYRELLLWPLAHEWQVLHGPLLPGTRLVPKIPFVLGGEYTVANLYAAECGRALRFYGHIATQIHDLPDGSKIEFQPID